MYRVLVGKPEGMRPLGRLRLRWVDNIRMDVQEVGCGYVNWIGLAQNRDRRCRHHPHRKQNLRSGSQDHHPSKKSVQKTICCNSTSNAPDDRRIYPKYVELRIQQ